MHIIFSRPMDINENGSPMSLGNFFRLMSPEYFLQRDNLFKIILNNAMRFILLYTMIADINLPSPSQSLSVFGYIFTYTFQVIWKIMI